MVHRCGSVRGPSRTILGFFKERSNLRRWSWLQAVQPIKEVHQHFQSVLLAVLYLFAQLDHSFFHIWDILKLEVFLLERDGIVEDEVWSIFKKRWDSIPAEVPMKRTQDVGEHEGNVTSQGFAEDSGQSRKCIVGANCDSGNGAVGKDKNRSDEIDVLFDLSRNTLLVELILLKTAGVG